MVALGAPIVEMFDRWDRSLQEGNDTEAEAAVATLCVGVAFAMGTIVVVGRIRAHSSSGRACSVVSRDLSSVVASFSVPVPTSSPPTPLGV